ncbi:MAG TPA: glycosyltransferase [Chloroflexaceae bacterium]|nr:glycosyltransferase [Chloroflexaceae bacterium]
MERILILHALLGNGHRSAAEALASALRRAGGEAVVEDALDHVNPLVRRLWMATYSRVSERAPLLYKAFYEASDADSLAGGAAGTLRVGRLSHYFLADLGRLLARARPDAVVCTMQFPLQLMSYLRHCGALRVPLYVVVTDYVPHGSWVAAGVARYFVPSAQTAEGFARKGVDRARLCAAGVPVRPELAEPNDGAAARRRRGLPLDRPVISLFAGGLEPGRARELVAGLLAGPAPATLVAVAGRSEGLAAALADLPPGPSVELITYGAVDFVDDLVAASDLVVTKAGGLITAEVLARGRPLLLTPSMPGQEEWNADYVCATGAGVLLHSPEAVAATAFELLAQPERLAMMAEQAWRAGRPRAAHDVAASILADLRRPAAALAPLAPLPAPPLTIS